MRAVRRFSGENRRRLHLTEAAWIVAWAVLGGSMAAAPAAGTEAETASSEPIPDAVWQEMQGKSWHNGLPGGLQCPARDTLVLLTVPYHDFAGEARRGRLIVAKSVADKVGKVFDEIFASNAFRIERIELVDKYGGNDDASMAANNTSAFNCRLKTSGKSLSTHSFGTAIDINPVQNPYVSGKQVYPPAGRDFDEPGERTAGVTGLITASGVATKAFARQGWRWGGTWTHLKDYQHFSSDGT